MQAVFSSEGGLVTPETDVLLVDEMGILNAAYQVASIAFVGGSLADRGGHNALEPAAVKLPVIMGPNTYNNPVICQYLQDNGALFIVNDATALATCCQSLLADPTKAKQSGEAGYAVLRANQGAVEKTIEVIRSL